VYLLATTVGEWVGVIGLGFVGLCSLCSGVWWMSSVWFKLNATHKFVKSHAETCDKERVEMSAAQTEQGRVLVAINDIVEKHDTRLTELEGG